MIRRAACVSLPVLCGSNVRHFFVLVLSNAVLVLVIDARSVLARDSGTPLIAIMVE